MQEHPHPYCASDSPYRLPIPAVPAVPPHLPRHHMIIIVPISRSMLPPDHYHVLLCIPRHLYIQYHVYYISLCAPHHRAHRHA